MTALESHLLPAANRQEATLRRRTFLARAACAAAATVAAPGLLSQSTAAAADKKPWKMRLSTSTVQFNSLTVEKACQQIAALGFEGVDFWPANFGCPHLDEIEKRLGAEGLKELLAKYKLKLYAFTCYGHESSPDAKSYNPGYPKYAELLGKAGGGVAVRESGLKPPVNLRTEMKQFLEHLKPEVELAEKNNGYLAVENHGGRLLNSADSFKAFVDLNHNERLGVALAPYHLQAANISVEEVIGIVGKQLLFFYAWQFGKGLQVLPGIGPTDCTPWIAALAKAGYAWYVNPFMHDSPAPDLMAQSLSTAKDYLVQCYAKAVGENRKLQSGKLKAG